MINSDMILSLDDFHPDVIDSAIQREIEVVVDRFKDESCPHEQFDLRVLYSVLIDARKRCER